MKFNFEDKAVQIKFHHTNYHPKNTETQCILAFYRGDQKNGEYYGVAYKSKSDNFCKEIGRKISLLRAVENAGLSRQQKQKFFAEYWKERERETGGKRHF